MPQNKHFTFEIRKGSIESVVEISKKVDELKNPYSAEEYRKRLTDIPHLILVAYRGDMLAGFKVAYERDGYFYSWMGGVIPGFRRNGIALALAMEQENWAREQGYTSVTFKTRNIHKAMLSFALNNGFNIVKVDLEEEVGQHRIWLTKEL